MVVPSVKLGEGAEFGVVHSALMADMVAKGSMVRGKGWGHPSIPGVGRRGSSSNAQRSKKSVRQEENGPLSYVLVERKTRQTGFSVCSLDRIFYSLPG